MRPIVNPQLGHMWVPSRKESMQKGIKQRQHIQKPKSIITMHATHWAAPVTVMTFVCTDWWQFVHLQYTESMFCLNIVGFGIGASGKKGAGPGII